MDEEDFVADEMAVVKEAFWAGVDRDSKPLRRTAILRVVMVGICRNLVFETGAILIDGRYQALWIPCLRSSPGIVKSGSR